MEYWSGPKFNDDITQIPPGVTVHQASDRERKFERIWQTQFWWKSPEERSPEQGQATTYRTFEAEELVEESFAGLARDEFGCRYVHSEFRSDSRDISHFDGAIRIYSGEQYLDRLDLRIDRAGKYARYVKLFRVDGAMPIPEWKNLTSMYFRGNWLLLEYLHGALQSSRQTGVNNFDTPDSNRQEIARGLKVYINYSMPDAERGEHITLDSSINLGGQFVPYIEGSEQNPNELQRHFIQRIPSGKVTLLDHRDSVFNAPRIVLAADGENRKRLSEIITDLLGALDRDIAASRIGALSLAFAWNWHGLRITLSIAGAADEVREGLVLVTRVVDPVMPPSAWISALKSVVAKCANTEDAIAGPTRIVHPSGVLMIPHKAPESDGEIGAMAAIPKAVADLLSLSAGGGQER